jgi:glucosamine-6-phosphate deaminase
LAEIALKRVQTQLLEKPESVLALACGRTMEPLWEKLSLSCIKGELSMRDARVLCVTELLNAAPYKSCRHALETGLFQKTDIRPENCFFPDPMAAEEYDRLIRQLGGLDFAVLGIGENGHIGYNEPGTFFDSRTHVQYLTERTKRQLLKRGFTDADIPEKAVTMGVKTLTKARDILLLAAGEEKAAAVYQMLYARTTSYVPAAYLQIPLNVTVLLDQEAAKMIV